MDGQTVVFALYEVGLSLVFGLVTVMISLRILNRTFLKRGWTGNTAASVFAASVVLSVLVLVQGSVLPAVDTLRAMALGRGLSLTLFGLSMAYFLLFYVISLGVAIATIGLAIQIYMSATVDVDELSEIRKENLGVAVLMAAVLFGMTVFLRDPVQRLNASLIDYDWLTAPTAIEVPPDKEDIQLRMPE